MFRTKINEKGASLLEGFVFTERSRKRLNELVNTVNSHLEELKRQALEGTGRQSEIVEAMWYSLSAGGKRLRPVFVLEFCRICGGNEKQALSAACALEMIHTFSLIHDDLPCMDDDDMRRGKPSCHKAYGEANALLAGDALLNLAYEIIGSDESLPHERRTALICELSRAVGISGMIGGQVIDTTYTGETDEKLLLDMYSMKTGALLKAACRMGCIAAGAGEAALEAAESYAGSLGLAFQIIDDILDMTGDEKLLGKPVGSDADNGKNTYASLCGIEKAKKQAESFTNEAYSRLDSFADNDFLKELTLYLLKRDY